MPPCVCVFSLVSKTSPVDQQDFELLTWCRINRAELCVLLSMSESVQACRGCASDINYEELIFTDTGLLE